MVLKTTLAETAPQRLKMSYEAYLDLPDDTRIMEWVEGEVIIYMPPLYKHQAIVGFLDSVLRLFIQLFDLGDLVLSPFEVKLWPDGPAREPDIIFVSNKNTTKLTAKRFEGAPDLAIEVISPSSVTEDRVHKFAEYEKAGVREYWIIDPRPHQQQADFYVLDQNQTFQPGLIDENGIYRSTVLPNFWLHLDWLQPEALPNPQLALAEIIISIEDLPPAVRAAYQAIYQALVDKN